jgi:hypothetical protein
MTSPIANLFLSLQAYIAALQDADGNAYFAQVDQDLGQLERSLAPGRPSVAWPCVLIDIDNLTYKDVSQNAQTGEATIMLRLAFPPISSSSSITPAEYRERAIYYYDLEQVLYQAVQGWSPYQQDGYSDLKEIFGAFSRKNAHTEKHHGDKLRVRNIAYTIGITDYSTHITLVYQHIDGADFTIS